MRAYVFIQLSADPAKVVADARKVAGVKSADALFGPTDAIAQVEAPDLSGITQAVFRLRGVSGVASTDTSIAVEM